MKETYVSPYKTAMDGIRVKMAMQAIRKVIRTVLRFLSSAIGSYLPFHGIFLSELLHPAQGIAPVKKTLPVSDVGAEAAPDEGL